MKEKIETIKSKLLDDLVDVKTLQDIVDIKAKYIGKSGLITELTKNMRDLSVDERKEIGKLSNELKNSLSNKIEPKIEKEVKVENKKKEIKKLKEKKSLLNKLKGLFKAKKQINEENNEPLNKLGFTDVFIISSVTIIIGVLLTLIIKLIN